MHVLRGRVATHQAQHKNDRREDGKRHAQYADERRYECQVDQHGEEVRHVETGNKAPDETLVFNEQHRPGFQTPDHHAAQQNRGSRRPGNTQGEHRQHGTRAGSVVSRFRCGHALNVAFAKRVRILGHRLGHAVGHDRSRGCTGSRQYAHKVSQKRSHKTGFQ